VLDVNLYEVKVGVSSLAPTRQRIMLIDFFGDYSYGLKRVAVVTDMDHMYVKLFIAIGTWTSLYRHNGR
jgi:hypothetical protein